MTKTASHRHPASDQHGTGADYTSTQRRRSTGSRLERSCCSRQDGRCGRAVGHKERLGTCIYQITSLISPELYSTGHSWNARAERAVLLSISLIILYNFLLHGRRYICMKSVPYSVCLYRCGAGEKKEAVQTGSYRVGRSVKMRLYKARKRLA